MPNVQTSLRIRPSEHAWEQFPDPHGRPTTPVRILKLDDPYLLEADFPPDFRAGLHWHPHDTIYLITAGEMQFGDEGLFRPGDVRWVRGGHAYGPERAGPAGVRFHLMSLGGPVGLYWADLYPVPAALGARLARLPAKLGRARIGSAPAEPWPTGGADGVTVEILAADPALKCLRFAPGSRLAELSFPFATLALLRSGSLSVAGESDYAAGDLRSAAADAVAGPLLAGPAGAELLIVGITPT